MRFSCSSCVIMYDLKSCRLYYLWLFGILRMTWLAICLLLAGRNWSTWLSVNRVNTKGLEYPRNLSSVTQPLFWPSAPNFAVSSVRGRRHGRQPLISGRRPLMAQAVRALAGGLRLVTEGYSGVPPLPPTPGGVTSSSPPTHQNPCKLRCFLRVVLKNIVFYSVLWPSVLRKLILALSKNHAFYVVFGFRGGPGREKITCCRCLNMVRPNLSTWWGNIGPR